MSATHQASGAAASLPGSTQSSASSTSSTASATPSPSSISSSNGGGNTSQDGQTSATSAAGSSPAAPSSPSASSGGSSSSSSSSNVNKGVTSAVTSHITLASTMANGDVVTFTSTSTLPDASSSSTASASSSASTSSNSTNIGAIVGGVAGGVAGIILIAWLVLLPIRRRHKRKQAVEWLAFGDGQRGSRSSSSEHLHHLHADGGVEAEHKRHQGLLDDDDDDDGGGGGDTASAAFLRAVRPAPTPAHDAAVAALGGGADSEKAYMLGDGAQHTHPAMWDSNTAYAHLGRLSPQAGLHGSDSASGAWPASASTGTAAGTDGGAASLASAYPHPQGSSAGSGGGNGYWHSASLPPSHYAAAVPTASVHRQQQPTSASFDVARAALPIGGGGGAHIYVPPVHTQQAPQYPPQAQGPTGGEMSPLPSPSAPASATLFGDSSYWNSSTAPLYSAAPPVQAQPPLAAPAAPGAGGPFSDSVLGISVPSADEHTAADHDKRTGTAGSANPAHACGGYNNNGASASVSAAPRVASVSAAAAVDPASALRIVN